MVRPEVVSAKIGRAEAWLNDSATLLLGPLEVFLSDRKDRDLALFYLFLAIQECIDVAAHWVADEGWEQPDDAGSAFDILADRQVIDRATASTLHGATKLRNRIGHGYALLDYERNHREAQIGIPALRSFLLTAAHAASRVEDSRPGED